MQIKETYAVFKEKHPNVKIGICNFASLQPSQVLLSSQVPSIVLSAEYNFQS